jgi:DNA-binding transcriptional LysR family regulator
MKPSYSLRILTNRVCALANVHPKIIFEGDDTNTIASLVASNLGVSLLPKIPGSDAIGIRQILDCRETRHPAFVVRLHCLRPRLLQHDFRDPHMVRIPWLGFPPRKIALIGIEPGKKALRPVFIRHTH